MLDSSSFAVATGMAAVAVTTKEVTPVTERETSRPLTLGLLHAPVFACDITGG